MHILEIGLAAVSIFLIIQGVFTIFLMLYAWDNPQNTLVNSSPIQYYEPFFSFSAIIPAYREQNVIRHTLESVSNIRYPEKLNEIIVVCHTQDIETINSVEKFIKDNKSQTVRLALFSLAPITKAHALNTGLKWANNDVVAVFDAEDEPHPDILNIVNTTMLRDQADVIQSGVQLMNVNSSWFSVLNVLEYFFWFKSALHFFAKIGVVPLGGNTIFIKKHWIEYVGGWNENMLTEDADIGIRLSRERINIRIVYDERHVTKEETPPDIKSFIRQRTRWNQGFLQVLAKGDWLNLPSFKKQFFAAYVLSWPILQCFFFLYLIASIVMAFTVKLSPLIVIISLIPSYLLLLQLVILLAGLYEFSHVYKIKIPGLFPLQIIFYFLPFYFVLGISAFRAIVRYMSDQIHWEKTPHINAHRQIIRQFNFNRKTIQYD